MTRGSYATTIDAAELARLRGEGRTLHEMAERFGVTHRTISRHLARHGLSKEYRRAGWRVTPEWKQEAEALLDDGMSVTEAARTLGCNFETVDRHFPGRTWDRKTSGAYAYAVTKANQQLARQGLAPLRAA